MAEEFEGPFECIEEKNYIYKGFSVPRKKEVMKIDKDGEKSVKTMSYKIKIFDSMRFTVTSLTKVVNNLSEGIHKIKCKDCNYSFKNESVKNKLKKIIQKSLMKN